LIPSMGSNLLYNRIMKSYTIGIKKNSMDSPFVVSTMIEVALKSIGIKDVEVKQINSKYEKDLILYQFIKG